MDSSPNIFASLDDFVPPGGGSQVVGRNMANNFFFRALMRYGSFDAYHFFLSNRAHRNLFMEKHAPFLNDPEIAPKIRLFDRVDLPDALRKYDYTVIHQSDHVTHLAALARLRNTLGARVPLSAFIHSLSYPAYMPRYLEMHFSGFCEADTIVCSSECGKKVVAQCLENTTAAGYPRSKVTLKVVPLGIDEPPGVMDRQLARKQLGFKNNQVVGLCFGRFSDFDKMDLFPLLQALKKVPGRDYRMVLAGAVHDQEYFRILQLWVKAMGLLDRVEFVVEPPNQKKLALFAGADFFVSIADNPQETFGLTVLEALHAGTPVIVSDYDGYRELAGDKAGIRVTTRWMPVERLIQLESIMDMRTLHRYLAQSLQVDMNELTQALRLMYTDAGARQNFAEHARERFANEFNHARIIATLEDHWRTQKRMFTEIPKELIPLQMDIFKTFAHYVTETPDGETKVMATDFARQLLAANVDYPLLPSMSEVIDSRIVKELVRHCFKPCVVGDIYSAFGDGWRTVFIVMWALKHDLLEVTA
ncbi:MAG: glycosyltransferase family 4 protein [Deltaproteobacteria bacterium]|nr:glycosyltransferase family 4 protein [Deltaproteobacteria bacterium]